MPFTAFCKPSRKPDGKYTDTWLRLASDGHEKIGFFAGIHMKGWEGVRDSKSGRQVLNLFTILTTDPSQSVQETPRAIPAILTTIQEYETWLSAPWPAAAMLQRAVPHSMIVPV